MNELFSLLLIKSSTNNDLLSPNSKQIFKKQFVHQMKLLSPLFQSIKVFHCIVCIAKDGV